MKRILILLVFLSLPAVPDNDPARSLLAKYDWRVEKEEPSHKVAFSRTLKGNPELFYQNASTDIGLDLGQAKGAEVEIRHFLLKERGRKAGSNFRAAVALHKGAVVGAWLYSDAPIAPGIFSLKEKKMLDEL